MARFTAADLAFRWFCRAISFSFILFVVAIADVNGGELFWSAFGSATIEKVKDDGTGRQLLISGVADIIGLDIDLENRLMYWNNRSLQKIQRADIDGNNITNIVAIAPLVPSSTSHVSLDLKNDKIYWSTGSGNEIRRANLDGTQVETVVSGLRVVDGIDIDGFGGYIYWTEQIGSRIARARLDGSGVETLVNIATPFGATDILLDPSNGYMYWSEQNANMIRRANLDGSNPQTVLTLAERPFGIALDGRGNIYWADLDGGRIRRAMIGGQNVSTLVTGLNKPRDVVYLVPEPSAPSLTCAFGALLFCLRIRSTLCTKIRPKSEIH
jgi:hypothetical protein